MFDCRLPVRRERRSNTCITGSACMTGAIAGACTGAVAGASTTIRRESLQCSRKIRIATDEFDLVVEGTARKVTDPSTVAAMAERWAAPGWPARVDDSGMALTAEYSAPSAGPPPWFVYRLTPEAATALGTADPGGATRWR